MPAASASLLRLRAVSVAAAVLLTLAGCALLPTPVPQVPTGESTISPGAGPGEGIGNAGYGNPGQRPATESTVADAAATITQRYEAIKAKDYASACTLMTAEYVERFAFVSATEGADCETVMATAFATSDAAIDIAEEIGEVAVLPYYYVPTDLSIDLSLIQADSEDTVYVPSQALSTTDGSQFRSSGVDSPGWIAESFYLGRDTAGIWRFIAPAEK